MNRQAIKMVRTSELKPYVVFVKPPQYDRLKETRASSYARSTFDHTSTRGFTVRRPATLAGCVGCARGSAAAR